MSIRLITSTTTLDPGRIEVMACDLLAFAVRLRSTNHTLKRALIDQHVLAGIGNACTDKILLHTRLSPFKQGKTFDDKAARLFKACRLLLDEWMNCLRAAAGEAFPTCVTAFQSAMALLRLLKDN